MGFKAKEFTKAVFTHRERTLTREIKDLSDWFDGEPAWTVRNLSFDEMNRCKQQVRENYRELSEAITALVQTPTPEAIREARDSFGTGEKPTTVTALACEVLVVASTDPKIDIRIAYKLAENYPVEFETLYQTAFELYGQGSVTEKKSKPSGNSANTSSLSSNSGADTSTSTAPT